MQSSGDHPETKHIPKKHPKKTGKTECKVNRDKGCGICGSLNVVSQGVKYCSVCGAEVEFLGYESYEWYSSWHEDVPCRCVVEWRGAGGKVRSRRDILSKSVMKCLDCGAVGSIRLCPNKHSGWMLGKVCWRHWDGRVYCQACGFRSAPKEG